MKPLKLIYWSRASLGVGAAFLCLLLNIFSPGLSIFSSLSVALIVYMVAYYIFKWKFIALVEKPSKIATTGIGAYFVTWIVGFGLFYTLWTSL
ncbi:MAG: hypothetical protein NWE77_08185 [Candidatus Bathyarchaeota archaeon]|jgi:hypothetical protein|nr:hypothetical protein [Candidatus Bathyarchaeota archaeon]UCD40336.1 MAG: hypothetical protein JSV87_02030 [Candidatus Bathyarchaeota archaeon]